MLFGAESSMGDGKCSGGATQCPCSDYPSLDIRWTSQVNASDLAEAFGDTATDSELAHAQTHSFREDLWLATQTTDGIPGKRKPLALC